MSAALPVSYWLEEIAPISPRPALSSDLEVDVAVVGGGFSGLWTAWHLLELDPSLRIAVLESSFVGFGASGRNGGWCTSNMGLSAPELADRYGVDGAHAVIDTMRESVDAIGAAGVECDYRKNGLFFVARGAAQVPSLRHSFEALDALDRADGVEWLDEPAAASYVKASHVRAAMRNPHGASIQPAKLAQGLADVLSQRGVEIFEETPVLRISERGSDGKSRAETPGGTVRAGAVTVSTEAWTDTVGPRGRVLPVYSLIVLSAPLSDDQWAEVGWERGECLASYQLMVDYLTKTPDGRIMFGGRGAPYHYGSRIDPAFDHHDATHTMLRESVSTWWPHLADLEFTHAWGGPLGITRDFTPNIGFDHAAGIGTAFGYVGQGVATAHLAGRYLAADILDRRDHLRPLPFLRHRSRRWEPEPLRWLGARYVQRSFARLDRTARRSGVAPSGRSLAERLFDH